MALSEEAQRLLQQLAAPDAILELDIRTALNAFIQKGGTPEQATDALADGYHGAADMVRIVSGWLALASDDEPETAARTVHEVAEDFLKQMLTERFDPDLVDDNLMVDVRGTSMDLVARLPDMILHPSFRTMLYELSERHPKSQFLTYALLLISQGGFEREISNLSSASRNLDVYSRVLVATLLDLNAEDETLVATRIAAFVRFAGSEPHTFLLTQALLHRLQQHTDNAPWLRRLSSDLATAVVPHGRWALHLSSLVTGLAAYPKLADAIASIVLAGTATAGDVFEIDGHYNGEAEAPPIALLRQAPLLRILMTDLFGSDSTIEDDAQRRTYCRVLALAASADDVATPTLNALVTALDDLHGLLVRARPVGSALDGLASRLADMLNHPVLGVALCTWLRKTIADPEFYRDNYAAAAKVPTHFLLLDEVALRFPLLREHVFHVYTAEFDRPLDMVALRAIDIRKAILDGLVFLLARGWVLPALSFMLDRAATADVALHMHFVDKVLAVALPPYSAAYASHLLRLLLAIHAVAPQALPRARFAADVLHFVDVCTGMPALASLDASHLRSALHAARSSI